MSDEMERDSSSPKSHGGAAARDSASVVSAHHQAAAAAAALNYSAFINASVGDSSAMLSSTENLLRNIQGLLKVAAENARQQDRQANYEKGIFPIFPIIFPTLIEYLNSTILCLLTVMKPIAAVGIRMGQL